jgi:hypothetical protein
MMGLMKPSKREEQKRERAKVTGLGTGKPGTFQHQLIASTR